jgi:hypothetical protein
MTHLAGAVGDVEPAVAGIPSSFAWGRGAGDRGRVAYVTTDGGVTAPPPGKEQSHVNLR